MKLLKVLAICSIAIISGCASIVTGTTTPVNIVASNGKGIKVNADGQEYTTPAVALLAKTGESKIVTTQEATCDQSTLVKKQIEPWFFGNFIFGGVFGSTTDFATDKMWTYADSIVVQCR